MLTSTIIIGVFTIILFLIGYFKGAGQHISGIKLGLSMTLQFLPLLIIAFLLAGLIQVLLPRELISRWVGAESGMRGILLGTVAGALITGNPYVFLPVLAGLLRAGASLGAMVAFFTGCSLLSVTRLPLEFGILGWKFALIRLASTFFFAPIAGLIAQALFGPGK